MPKNNSKPKILISRGFTLIELLIAISIVAIVFGVIITSASAAQKTARDTQRKADLGNIQAALQQFYADQQYFPDLINLSSAISITDCTGNITPCTVSKTYLRATPLDPKSTTYLYASQPGFISAATSLGTACNYTSTPNTKCHYYVLCAKLENGAAAIAHCTSISGGSGYNYEVNPL